MTAPPVVLHVGLHRTGTTALQRFLWANREQLRAHGVVYPQAGLAPGNENRGHRQFVEELQQGGAAGPATSAMLAEMEASGAATAVVSAEELSRMRGGVAVLTTWFRRAGFEDLRAVMYVRHPVAFLESAWKQQVKTGAYGQPLSRFVSERLDRADYLAYADHWQRHLGPGRLDVRVYEAAVAGPGLVGDFVTAIGMDATGADWAVPRDLINASPDDRTLRAIRLVTRLERRAGPVAPALARMRRMVRRRPGLIRWMAADRPAGDLTPAEIAGRVEAELGSRHRRFVEAHVAPDEQRHLHLDSVDD